MDASFDASPDPSVDASPDASADAAPDASVAVALEGSIQKGPFILGSSISISALDDSGNPTGQVFLTQTTNDRGEFSVQFPWVGPVALTGDGFYYNEVTGDLSTAPITLRAFHEVTHGGDQEAYVNLITHLTYLRVSELLRSGLDLATAVPQAEGELRAGLGVGPPGFDPGAAGVEMNVLGGDTDANAYLLAVSAVMVQAVYSPSGPIDAAFQQLSNWISSDLAPDGVLPDGLATMLLDAQRRLDSRRVMEMLQQRFGGEVPDIDRVLDWDLDGVVNATDNCIRVPNPLQEDADADGRGDACASSVDFEPAIDFPTGRQPRDVAIGDVNADGSPDLAVNCDGLATFSIFLNTMEDGAEVAAFAEPVEFQGSGDAIAMGDLNADDLPDLVLAEGYDGWAGVYLNTTVPGSMEPSFAWRAWFSAGGSPRDVAIGDLNGDGSPDLVLVNRRENGSVSVLLNTTPDGALVPSFADRVELDTGVDSAEVAIADLNGDLVPDLAVTNGVGGTMAVLLNTTPAEASAPTFEPAVEFSAGVSPGTIVLGDLDGDARIDAAIANPPGDPGNVSILLNTTAEGALAPTFDDAAGFAAGRTWGGRLAIGDFTADGAPDLVYGGVSVLINRSTAGTPVLDEPLDFPTGDSVTGIAVADLNADARPDVVATNRTFDTVTVLLAR